MKHPHLVLVLGALVLVHASANAQAPTVRDSAGVRIIENPARETRRINLKLGDRPILDVGGLHDDNPAAEFSARQGYLRGVRFSDGGLAVIDADKVKYFDPAGRLLKVVGRSGDGPGEFRGLNAICRTRGDTIVVSDRARLGVLDRHGAFIRHIPSAPRYPPFDGCFGDGTVLLTSSEIRVPTPTTLTAHLWRAHLDGTRVDSLGDMVLSGLDVVTLGGVAWAAAGSRLYVGDAHRSDISVYELPARASDGVASSAAPLKLVMSIRTADRAIPITDAALDERLALVVGISPTKGEQKARMDQLRAMPRLSTWPLIGQIHVDPDGNLWVADYERIWNSATGYSKFDATGRLVGRLAIPGGSTSFDHIRVIGFGRNEILVRRPDDDGAEHLTVYPIVPMR